MSAGRGPQGQLHTEDAVAAGQSTRRERSQGTGGESSTQYQFENVCTYQNSTRTLLGTV